MVLSLSLGFFSVSGFGEYSFVGLDNYRRMLGDPLFWRSLRVTVFYIALLVPSLYVTGLGLALLVQRNNRFNGFVRTMLFVPQTVSLVVVAWSGRYCSSTRSACSTNSPLGFISANIRGWATPALRFMWSSSSASGS